MEVLEMHQRRILPEPASQWCHRLAQYSTWLYLEDSYYRATGHIHTHVDPDSRRQPYTDNLVGYQPFGSIT